MSTSSEQARQLVSRLQKLFVSGLERCASELGHPVEFTPVEWLRDRGRHGGGRRYASADNPVFNRASVNVSQVHYRDDPAKKLASATALSTIIHPRNAHAPSVHMHISWTEMKASPGYWRVMADLNPAIEKPEDTLAFRRCLERAAPDQCGDATAQGEKYFHIPALGRHRGAAHFYLEQYRGADAGADFKLAADVGTAVIECYLALLAKRARTAASAADRAEQLAYHTLYLYQVLTLDRGTTSGLLVHDQNDLGIMGSLPAAVDRNLLASWAGKMHPLQQPLLESIVAAIPENGEVGDQARTRLAAAVRRHYRRHPEALKLQASGNVVPPTVDNHR